MKGRSFLVISMVAGFISPLLQADEAGLPGNGFASSRYEILWTKSPFSVASAEAAPDSPDYSLVGIAQFDGVSYASIIDKKNNQEHFLLTTDKPIRGLTLVSIKQSKNSADTQAVLQKDGQTMTLKLEQAPAASPGAPPNMAANAPPPGIAPQIPMPGANQPPGTVMPGLQRAPLPMFRRPLVHVPPPPQGQSANSSQPTGLPTPQPRQAPQPGQ